MDAQIRNQMIKLRATFEPFDIASKVDPVSMEQIAFKYIDSDGNEWDMVNGQGMFPSVSLITGFMDARKNYVYPEDQKWANQNLARLFQWNIVEMAKAWVDQLRRIGFERKFNGHNIHWKIVDAKGKTRKIRLAPMSKLHLQFARYEQKRNGDTIVHSVITDRRLVPLSYRKFKLVSDQGLHKHINGLVFSNEDVLLALDPDNDGSVWALGDLDIENELPLSREVAIRVHELRGDD